MIIVMKQGAKKENIEAVIDLVAKNKLKPVPLYGTERTVIAVIGDERVLNKDTVEALDDVEKVMEVLKPYKLAAREYH
ncbi:3-deoxy-7-phosphoheptulonate synthase, partial [Candidatus Woesearchaeota archaeon]|nr:3-deoxy-7-phosphoheptulonate synthase [Candidatus Woesearchaeota archaeon]